MDKGQALDIARKYKSMVAEHLPLKALYLYGSYTMEVRQESKLPDRAYFADRG